MIGIFDSGVGGLTIVKEIFKYLPEYQIIYFGDTARLPYGTKGAQFVKKYSAKITEWLIRDGAEIVVVACNTSSAWAADSLKRKFKKTPIFEMVNPVVKEIKRTQPKKVAIIGTPGTIRSNIYQKRLLRLNPNLKVYSKACPLLVPLVEEGWLNKKITSQIAKEYLRPLQDKQIDALVLACTHYPLLIKVIKKIVGSRVKVINPAESLAQELKTFLNDHPKIAKKITKGKKHRFFFSDQPYNFQLISQLCFKKKIKAKIVDPF
jgi:glutamate racemase